ncbi:hypothetical protein [Cesiribacter andamanensis]|uniref:Uncharacterized protein n=1 Tax=Cesiribacter andamanensis AMV16 TaxID=1279009 RepID=M7NBN3_9BACT|nr:hypothetical protein [Cesiribacter andamanensis]EMR04596.1 hypothetical protein ADICEAN_00198 [Cesiribacter andamanensis AMV16]
MKKQYNSWESHLGQRLQGLEGQPPADAWERLEAELDQKPRRSAWWMAAAIGLLISSGAYMAWQAGDSAPLNQLAGDNSLAPAPDQNFSPADDPTALNLHQQQAVPQPAVPSPSAAAAAPDNEQVVSAESPTTTHRPTDATAPVTKGLKINRGGETPLPARAAVASSSREAALPGAVQAHTASERAYARQTAHSTMHDKPATRSMTPVVEAATYTTLPQLAARRPEGFPLTYQLAVPRLERPQDDWYAVVPAEKQAKKGGKALLWSELMPTWSYRQVEPNPADAVVITAMESQPAFSGSRFGAQAALGVSLPVRKNLEWKTGAFYGMQQEQWSYTYRNAQADYYRTSISESGAYTVVPEYRTHTSEINHTLHNLGLTSGFRYSMPTRFSTSHADARLLTFYNSYQKISSFVTLAYSIELPFDTGFGIHIGPSLQVQLHSSEELSPHFQEKPLVFGLQLGASMNRP